jgi:hypothetical protein
MSGYLSTLVSRTLRPGDSVQPRLRSLFAPPTPGRDGPQMLSHADEVVAGPESLDVSEVVPSEPPIPARDSEIRHKESPALATSTEGRPALRKAPPNAPPVAGSQNIERESQPELTAKNDPSRETEAAQDIIPAPDSVPHQRPEKRTSLRHDTPPLQLEPTAIQGEHAPMIASPVQNPRSTEKKPATNANQLTVKRLNRQEVPREGETKPTPVAPCAIARRNLLKDQPTPEGRPVPERVLPLSVSPLVQDVPSLTSARKRESDSFSVPRSPKSVRARAMDSPLKPPPPVPTIEVTIGRVEVRATPVKESVRATRPAAPVVGLEEYLRRRSERSSG